MAARRGVAGKVASLAWLSRGPLEVAGCVTLSVGSDREAVAAAFGVDLTARVPASTAPMEHVAQVHDGAAGAVVVVEDNGFEGSRAVVLRAASRHGKAASIFWNVNGLVVFSCARRGKVLYSEEFAFDDEHDGLPRSLMPFAELAAADDADLVAIGAAMVVAFTGVEVEPAAITDEWHLLTPQVEEPTVVDAASSPLRWNHPALVDALASTPSDRRRPLAAVLAGLAAREGSLVDDDVVVEVLASVSPATAGTRTTALERFVQRAVKDDEALWARHDYADSDGRAEPLAEEAARVHRASWVGRALLAACHPDELSAVLGLADAVRYLASLDDHEQLVVDCMSGLATAPPDEWPALLARLPAARSPADRDAALIEQQAARVRAELEREAAWEAEEWGGLRPTGRMRAADSYARGFAWTDPDLLVLLAGLDDEALRDTAVWGARRILADSGLADRPWLADALRDLEKPEHESASEHDQLTQIDKLQALFALLRADAGLSDPTSVDRAGQLVSRPYMALPVVLAARVADALAAACAVLDTGYSVYGMDTPAFYAEVRARLGLPPATGGIRAIENPRDDGWCYLTG